jgi:hypothetical protein
MQHRDVAAMTIDLPRMVAASGVRFDEFGLNQARGAQRT